MYVRVSGGLFRGLPFWWFLLSTGSRRVLLLGVFRIVLGRGVALSKGSLQVLVDSIRH